jgi:hypothetical protein
MSGELRAFRLTQESQDFAGGTVCYGSDQSTFDVGRALLREDAEGNVAVDPGAVIVTDDVALVNALADYPAVESCEVPVGAAPIPVAETPAEVHEETTETEVPDTAPAQTPQPDVAAVHGDEDDLNIH